MSLFILGLICFCSGIAFTIIVIGILLAFVDDSSRRSDAGYYEEPEAEQKTTFHNN